MQRWGTLHQPGRQKFAGEMTAPSRMPHRVDQTGENWQRKAAKMLVSGLPGNNHGLTSVDAIPPGNLDLANAFLL
jgi:hypothetical protein